MTIITTPDRQKLALFRRFALKNCRKKKLPSICWGRGGKTNWSSLEASSRHTPESRNDSIVCSFWEIVHFCNQLCFLSGNICLQMTQVKFWFRLLPQTNARIVQYPRHLFRYLSEIQVQYGWSRLNGSRNVTNRKSFLPNFSRLYLPCLQSKRSPVCKDPTAQAWIQGTSLNLLLH